MSGAIAPAASTTGGERVGLGVRRVDLRFLAPALLAWFAAFVAVSGVPIVVPGVLWTLSGTCAAFAVVAGRDGANSRWHRAGPLLATAAVCLVAAAFVSTVAALALEGRHPPAVSAVAASHRVATVHVVTSAGIADGRVEGTLVRLTAGRTTSTVSTPVLVFLDDSFAGSLVPVSPAPGPEFGIGTTIEVRATVVEAANEDDIGYLVFATSEPVERSAPPWYLEWGNGLRHGFSTRAADLAGDGGDLLPGLAIGDTSAVDTTLDSAMKASSLSHLTAVSGANCAIVVGLVMATAAALGCARWLRIGIAIVVLVGFVVLVTPEPSVLRAAVMAVLVLLALAGGRPLRGVPVLAAAVLMLLGTDPWLARDYGFALSVLATGALLVFASPLALLLARWIPLPLAVVIAVPIAAQLACQPVLILLNSSIPVYGVVANLLAEPAAPIATVLGLLACVTLPFVPALGGLFAQVAWLPAAWIAAVARFIPTLPGSQLPWLAGLPGVVLLALLTALLLVAALARRRVRLVAVFLAVILASGSIAGIVANGLVIRSSRPADWQVAACDIGQGDAVLVRSENSVALVDTGPDPALLRSCLDDLGIQRLDLLVLTHYDLDHVGGVDAVVGMVDTALVGPTDGASDVAVVESLRSGGATVTEGSRGMTGRLGDLRWTLLWPRSPLAGVEPGNAASLAMTFLPEGACQAGCLSSLFLGDLGQESQALMLAAGAVPPVDVVKVAHHGSADQEARLYEAASAALGIISVGADNTYGHPTEELLGILAATGSAAARTDRQGMILVSPRVPTGTGPTGMVIYSSGPRSVFRRERGPPSSRSEADSKVSNCRSALAWRHEQQ